jgi:hypothetical protein
VDEGELQLELQLRVIHYALSGRVQFRAFAHRQVALELAALLSDASYLTSQQWYWWRRQPARACTTGPTLVLHAGVKIGWSTGCGTAWVVLGR